MIPFRLLHFLLIINAVISFPDISFAQRIQPQEGSEPPAPKKEVRAAWVVTVRGANWPKSLDPEEQKRALVLMFQSMKRAHLNTVVLQVRARGDLLYPSQYEPWAQSLTGTLGGTPTYDALRFAVEEAHRLGLEVHAWWNVVKVADGPERPPATVPLHVVNAHHDWVKPWTNRDRNGKPSSTEWWLDMGIPEVRAHLVTLVMEMVRAYEIDGVHFDYLRYPGLEFDDDKTYVRYGNSTLKDDWRRENINKFVRAIYDSIMSVKPMLKVGSAPIGIYKNLPGAEGWQAYIELSQDARRWLAEGKQDYIMPQIYWGLTGNPRFNILIHDWQENSHSRHVYAGVAAYKPNVLNEIPALIDTTRRAGALGNCFFTYDDISRGEVLAGRYRYPALIPPMQWKDSIAPNPPMNLTAVEENPRRYLLQWFPPLVASDGDGAKYFAIYRFFDGSPGIDNPSNLLATVPGDQSTYLDEIPRPTSPRYRYVITAIDKGNLESAPSSETAVMVAELVALSRPFQPIPLLAQNTPNPFSDLSFIAYELRGRTKVGLKISDAEGRDVATLVNGLQDAGRYIVTLDGEKLRTGHYTYTLSANGFSATKSMEISK